MPQIRKVIRDALVAALADESNGFNAQLSALATSYGITAFSIDWTSDSQNFAQAQLDPEQMEMFFAFERYPAALVYTSSSINEHRLKYQTFSGQVLAHIDILLRYRSHKDEQHPGNVFSDTNDLESIANAVEDTLLSCLDAMKATLRQPGFYWNGDYRMDRDPVQLYGDGHGQRISVALGFERHV